MREKRDLAPDSIGGFGGGLFQYDQTRAAELKLINRALRSGWNPSPELKKKILDRMELIIDCEADDKLAIKAAAVVISADKADIAAARNDVESSKTPAVGDVTIHYHRLSREELEKLEELMVKAGVCHDANDPDASIGAEESESGSGQESAG